MIRLFLVIGMYCSMSTVIFGESEEMKTLAVLVSKVEKILGKIEDVKFLDKAFEVASIGEKLSDVSQRMDTMQRKMTLIETKLHEFSRIQQPSVDISKYSSGWETKLEQYTKKQMDMQNFMRNDAKEQLSITRSFKGALEDGVNKILTKLNNRNEEDDNELFAAIDSVKQEAKECTASTAGITKRVDDIYTDMDTEWKTAHRVMREMDIKLDQLKNGSTMGISRSEITHLTTVVRKHFKEFEDLEPKLTHAARVTKELQATTTDLNDHQNKTVKMLSESISSTLKTLQNSLEANLKSVQEGIEILDGYLEKPQNSRSLVFEYWSVDKLTDILSEIDRQMNQKLEAVGDQIKMFLSSEALSHLDLLKEEMSKLKLQQEVINHKLNVSPADVLNAITELTRNCTNSPSKDALKQRMEKLLRNAMG